MWKRFLDKRLWKRLWRQWQFIWWLWIIIYDHLNATENMAFGFSHIFYFMTLVSLKFYLFMIRLDYIRFLSRNRIRGENFHSTHSRCNLAYRNPVYYSELINIFLPSSPPLLPYSRDSSNGSIQIGPKLF